MLSLSLGVLGEDFEIEFYLSCTESCFLYGLGVVENLAEVLKTERKG